MKNLLLALSLLLLTIPAFAQPDKLTREDKDEKNAARTARVNTKNDYILFRKQIMALKQFDAEKQKIPALRKASKMNVKVSAVIDSNDNDADGTGKTLIGYIRQDVGDNATNMYEITYDRAQKQIVSVKHTPEAIEADRDLMEDQPEKATPKKAGTQKTIKKKNKDDDDDDEPEDKPAKSKQKTRDDDD